MSDIVKAPGTQFETNIDWGITGLAGTLAVRLVDGVGGTSIARTTTGIAEFPAGSGRYEVTLTAPTTQGDYQTYWDDGSVTPPHGSAGDTLTVTYSSSGVAAPANRDLCTLADVQAYIPGYDSDPDTDTILQELITSVSTEMQKGREFRPITTNPSAKVFDLSYWDATTRTLDVGDLANTTSLEVAVTQWDGTAVATVDMTDDAIVALPRNRQEWEPYWALTFPWGLTDAPALGENYILTVTGNWGFPSIPPDIRTACIKLVIVRYLRDVAAGGTAFADAVTDADFALATAFRSAMDTVESYHVTLAP